MLACNAAEPPGCAYIFVLQLASPRMQTGGDAASRSFVETRMGSSLLLRRNIGHALRLLTAPFGIC